MLIAYKVISTVYQVKEMEEKLVKLREGITLVRPEDKKAVEDMYADKINQWRKRKRMFRDIWDTVTENSPKDVKELKVQTHISSGVFSYRLHQLRHNF